VFWGIAGLGAAIVAIGLASTSARAKASAARVAGLLDVPPGAPHGARMLSSTPG
jgi:hypothetical protein